MPLPRGSEKIEIKSPGYTGTKLKPPYVADNTLTLQLDYRDPDFNALDYSQIDLRYFELLMENEEESTIGNSLTDLVSAKRFQLLKEIIHLTNTHPTKDYSPQLVKSLVFMKENYLENEGDVSQLYQSLHKTNINPELQILCRFWILDEEISEADLRTVLKDSEVSGLLDSLSELELIQGSLIFGYLQTLKIQ